MTHCEDRRRIDRTALSSIVVDTLLLAAGAGWLAALGAWPWVLWAVVWSAVSVRVWQRHFTGPSVQAQQWLRMSLWRRLFATGPGARWRESVWSLWSLGIDWLPVWLFLALLSIPAILASYHMGLARAALVLCVLLTGASLSSELPPYPRRPLRDSSSPARLVSLLQARHGSSVDLVAPLDWRGINDGAAPPTARSHPACTAAKPTTASQHRDSNAAAPAQEPDGEPGSRLGRGSEPSVAGSLQQLGEA